MPWFKVDNDIIDKYGEQLGAYGLAVYMCIARFINQEGVAWPSYETITKRIGVSRKQVIREVKKLQELGLVEVTAQFNPETKENRSNLFTLKGGDSQSLPPSNFQSPPRDKVTPRKRLKKNYSQTNVIEERRSYQPADYGFV